MSGNRDEISKRDRELTAAFHRIYPALAKDKVQLNAEQLTIIRAILAGKDTLNILPTGGGKSACYLVPALLLPGVTLVISPLVSLIRDQVTALRQNGIPVACITSTFLVDRKGVHQFYQSGREREGDGTSRRSVRDQQIFLETVRAQNSPDGDDGERGYKIIYLTPERLRTGQFIRFAERAKISMIAVDEAHCISLWGYEFRRRYLEIPRFLERIDQRPVMAAFTATATAAVRRDILYYLSLKNPLCYPPLADAAIRKRDNLHFSVRTVPDHAEIADKEAYRCGMIREECRRLLREYTSQDRQDCILIYCLSVDQVRMYYKQFLRFKDLKEQTALYYAGLDSDRKMAGKGTRQENWEDFLGNKKKIMISTNALGMGVDKGNIRCVIHAGMPMSLENYYQEAGRAGRSRRGNARIQGDCILYALKSDDEICRKLINQSNGTNSLSGEQKALRLRIAGDRLAQIEAYCDTYLDAPLFAKDRENEGTHPEDPQDYIVEYFNTYRPAGIDPDDPDIRAVEETFQKEAGEIDVLYANRTKIAQMIRKGRMHGADVPVGRRGTDRTVSYEITGSLSYLDLMVADAVYTLLKHGRKKIYARHVAALLSGDHGIMLSPKNTAIINESICKMSRTRIRIDMSGSLQMGFFYDDETDAHGRPVPVLEGPFLPLEDAGGGFARTGRALPPLYEYAEIMNGQFHSFPLALLHVSPLARSFSNMAMTHYLLRRVDSMSTRPAATRRVRTEIEGEDRARSLRSVTTSSIKLDTMLDELGDFFALERFTHSSPYGRKLREIRDKEHVILDHLKQAGFILDYEPATVIRNGEDTGEPIEGSIRIIRRI